MNLLLKRRRKRVLKVPKVKVKRPNEINTIVGCGRSLIIS
jgi:hypothetical protein